MNVEPADERYGVASRVSRAVRGAIQPAWKTIQFLAAVTIPVSLIVKILDKSGLLAIAARALSPVMGLLGLPGEGSLVFLSAMALNIYSAIAVIGTLNLTIRELTILSVMCLVAHNLFVETAIMRKTGSSVLRMVTLRIVCAVFAAFILNQVLPQDMGSMIGSHHLEGGAASGGIASSVTGSALTWIGALLIQWLASMGPLLLKIAVLVSLLMVIQRLFDEFGVVAWLSRLMAPAMGVFGLSPATSFVWIVANVVGFAYGSGILIERVERGKLSLAESDLFNYHAGISHSLLEDTVLFVAIGVPLVWAMVPRILLAIAVVWLERLRRILFRRSFQVGVI